MTEIPEHLLKRAQAARERAAAENATKSIDPWSAFPSPTNRAETDDQIIERRARLLGLNPDLMSPNERIHFLHMTEESFEGILSIAKTLSYSNPDDPYVITAKGTSIQPSGPPVSENLLRESLTDAERNQLHQFVYLLTSSSVIALIAAELSNRYPHQDSNAIIQDFVKNIKFHTCGADNAVWKQFNPDKALFAAISVSTLVGLLSKALPDLPDDFLPGEDTLKYLHYRFYNWKRAGQ